MDSSIKGSMRKLVIEYRKVWICINCAPGECSPPTGGGDALSRREPAAATQ
jgi:hypothetical protein